MAKKPTRAKSVNQNLSLSKAKTETDRIVKVIAKSEEQRAALKSIHENKVTFLVGVPGSGKAQPLDALVYCPDGPRLMKDIDVGSYVLTPSGGKARVSRVFPQGHKDIYKIKFHDGSEVEACLDHLWSISERQVHDRKKIKVVDTKYLIEHMLTPTGERNIYIKLTEPVEFEYRDLLIDPYVLGLLIGDGSLSNANIEFTTADVEMAGSITSTLHDGYDLRKAKNKYGYRIVKKTKHSLNGSQANIYKDALRLYGLWGHKSLDKFIPEDYLYASVSQRWLLLQGLMDTDGYVCKDSGQAYFSTSSPDLAKDFKTLVDSLGGCCTISSKQPFYKKDGERKYCSTNYICCLNMADCSKAFNLQRKKSICRPRTKYQSKRIIVSIDYVGKKEAKCIMLDDNDHLYLTNGYVVTHNSHLAVGYGLQELKRGNFERIIFTRPLVEAGEKIGTMPGDVDAKMANFMIPMYEVVREYFDEDDIREMVENRIIVILPFAFMRGVNFKNAYVCADEVQNSTPQQMHLLLTRLCEGSKIVLTGDIYQSDLRYQVNGLKDAIVKLQGIQDLSFVELTYASCVRDKIVNDIDARYRTMLPNPVSIADILAEHKKPREPADIKPHVDDRRGTLYED